MLEIAQSEAFAELNASPLGIFHHPTVFCSVRSSPPRKLASQG